MATALALSICEELEFDPSEYEPATDTRNPVCARNSVLDLCKNHKLVFDKAWVAPPLDKVCESNAWQFREHIKRLKGEYKMPRTPVDYDLAECPRVVVDGKELFIEYFRNAVDGRAGRLTRTTPGSYFARFSTHDTLIRNSVEKIQEQYAPLDWEILENPDDTYNIYMNGPADSCMTKDASYWGLNDEHHPVYAYTGISDFRVFALKKGGKYIGRCVVNVRNKTYGRCYGRDDLLTRALKEAGFNKSYYSEVALTGAIAPRVANISPDRKTYRLTISIPYFDSSVSYARLDPYQDLARNIKEQKQVLLQMSGAQGVRAINGWDLPAINTQLHRDCARQLTIASCDCCGRHYHSDNVRFMKASFMDTKFPETNTVHVCYQCRPNCDDCTSLRSGIYVPKHDLIRASGGYYTKRSYVSDLLDMYPILIDGNAYSKSKVVFLNGTWHKKDTLDYDPTTNHWHERRSTPDCITFILKDTVGAFYRARLPEALRRELDAFRQAAYDNGFLIENTIVN